MVVTTAGWGRLPCCAVAVFLAVPSPSSTGAFRIVASKHQQLGCCTAAAAALALTARDGRSGKRRASTSRATGPSNPSAVAGQGKCHFPHSDPPYLALVTEACSCDSDEHVAAALEALEAAVATNLVDVVSVRVRVPERDAAVMLHEARLVRLVRQLLRWSSSSSRRRSDAPGRNNAFRVVVSSDYEVAGIMAGAHGVHFKEAHRARIPQARQLYQQVHNNDGRSSSTLLVGTSTHTVESALGAWKDYRPDYFFAGTCFETESHPEKSSGDLEGPAFPATVCRALEQQLSGETKKRPAVLSIGGLDATNCRGQVSRGHYVPGACADGIATIRAVSQADDPAGAVRAIAGTMAHVFSSSA